MSEPYVDFDTLLSWVRTQGLHCQDGKNQTHMSLMFGEVERRLSKLDSAELELQHSKRTCAGLQATVESWELAAQLGHPNPCTLGPLCPYCEIERLSSKLEQGTSRAERLRNALSLCSDELARAVRGSTHWADCEQEHHACRAITIAREALSDE